jgi:hypothetical protein
VRAFGKGRCFALLLGHDARTMQNAGFQALLVRGTEWAATGKVTVSASAATKPAKGKPRTKPAEPEAPTPPGAGKARAEPVRPVAPGRR